MFVELLMVDGRDLLVKLLLRRRRVMDASLVSSARTPVDELVDDRPRLEARGILLICFGSPLDAIYVLEPTRLLFLIVTIFVVAMKFVSFVSSKFEYFCR